MEKYWMVFMDGKHGKKPKVKHLTKMDACLEAMRLANEYHGLRFVVVESVSEYCFIGDEDV